MEELLEPLGINFFSHRAYKHSIHKNIVESVNNIRTSNTNNQIIRKKNCIQTFNWHILCKSIIGKNWVNLLLGREKKNDCLRNSCLPKRRGTRKPSEDATWLEPCRSSREMKSEIQRECERFINCEGGGVEWRLRKTGIDRFDWLRQYSYIFMNLTGAAHFIFFT